MKMEIKIALVSVVFSLICMFSFTYVCSLSQKTIYAYQVGIYKEKENKDDKLSELKDSGYQGYVYQKDDQFYVLSMITTQYDEVKEHSQKLKGIIKEYAVSSDTTPETLLESLSQGEAYD